MAILVIQAGLLRGLLSQKKGPDKPGLKVSSGRAGWSIGCVQSCSSGSGVLLLLRMHGTMSVSELATHAVFKLSTMTRVVQRMRVEGLVHTHTNKEDARVTDVSITPTGTELAARIDLATRKIFVACYAGLSPTQLERFSQTLRAMFRNLSEA